MSSLLKISQKSSDCGDRGSLAGPLGRLSGEVTRAWQAKGRHVVAVLLGSGWSDWPLSGRLLVGIFVAACAPHPSLGVVVVVEISKSESLHLQPCLQDPGDRWMRSVSLPRASEPGGRASGNGVGEGVPGKMER